MLKLLFSKHFAPLFWTQFLGAFNDNLLKNSLVVLITYYSLSSFGMDSKQMVSLAGAIFIFSFLLFSATSGQIAEKYHKNLITKKLKLFEILLMIIASLGFILTSPGILLFALFLMGFQSTLFGPIKYGLLPQLLAPKEMVKGNALIQMGTNIAIILGMISGGLLILLPNGRLWVISLLLFFSILGFYFSCKIKKTPITSPKLKIQLNLFSSTKSIIKESLKFLPLFWLVNAISLFWFFGAILLNVLPIISKNEFSSDNTVFTFFMFLFCGGIGIGSLLTTFFSRRKIELSLIPISLLGISFSCYFLSTLDPISKINDTLLNFSQFFQNPQFLEITMAFFLFSLFGGLYIVPLYTLMLKKTPSFFQSRIVAVNNILNSLYIIIASIFTMILYKNDYSSFSIFKLTSQIGFSLSILFIFLYAKDIALFCLKFLIHLFYNIKIVGDIIPSKNPYIIASNHISFLDWAFLTLISENHLRFVIHYDYYESKFFRPFLKFYNVIPIASGTENRRVLINAIRQIDLQLANNQHIGLFPEGKLSSNGKLDKLQTGIIKIVSKSNATVIPVVIEGMWGSIFTRKHNSKALSTFPTLTRRKVTIRIKEPIKNTELSLEKLKNQLEY